MEKVEYRGWPNCCKLSNGIIELIITGDVGPRIISLKFAGGENLFSEFAEMMGKTGGDEWRIYGGHRLWISPEGVPKTYHPDNAPVKVKEMKKFVRATPPLETTTGIQKEIDIALSPDHARVKVTHRLKNEGIWPVELAPWALSVMDAGGKVIVPFPPRGTHPECLLPANTLTLWPYTDMSDKRWTWGAKYLMLQQDSKAPNPQKAGVMVPDGWCACAIKGQLFVKSFDYVAGARYADWGSCVETFANNRMIEMETVGPLVTLEPGASVEHVENWSLFKDVPAPKTDADVDRDVLPRVKSVLS